MAKSGSTTSVGSKFSLGGDLALGAVIAELLASLMLTLAVLNTGGNAIVASVAVIILVLMFSKLSGGHINPVVTIGLLVTKQISWKKALVYIIAQLLGAMLAVVIASQFIKGSIDPATGMQGKLFSVTVTGDWRPFFAELVGALIFGFGVAASFLGKKEGYDGAFTIGGALLIGLIVAATGSSAILNPAVALGVDAFNFKNMWGLLIYAVAPALGAAGGALLYKLLQSDIDAQRSK